MKAWRRPGWRRALPIVTALALVFFLGPRMLHLLARKMLYPAPAYRVPSPPPAPLAEVRLELDSGTEVLGWASASPAPDAPAAVFFHGNGENLGTMRAAGLFDDLEGLGIHFLAVDYPGYGRSGGTPSEASLVAAGEAALAWLAERHPESPKALVGWSLGAAVAVQVARRHGGVDRLALMSAWDDLPTLAAEHFPRWLVGLALADRYDSVAAAPEIRVPTLLIHGVRDRIIPLAHGERLRAALPRAEELVRVPDAGHNDLLARPVVWRELARFLRGPEPASAE